MKRRFAIAIFVLFAFATIGGFINPTKSFATITNTSKEYKSLENEAGRYIQQGQDGMTALRDLNLYILGDQYNKIGLAPNTTINTFRVAVYTELVNQLEEISANDVPAIFPPPSFWDSFDLLSDAQKTIRISDALIDANQKLSNSKLFVQQEQGTLNQAGVNAGMASTSANAIAANGKLLASLNNETCSIGAAGSFSLTACLNDAANWLIQNILLRIAGWFLWLGSSLLDLSINYGILQFASWAPAGIYNLWRFVRDILYLCIVFIGFYLAFMYIIGRDEKLKKFIPWLIFFALFVNFSLPITKAVIDVSNIVSLNLYNSAVAPGPNQSAGTAIMEKLGIQSLITGNLAKGISTPAALMAVAMVFFAAWVFFQVAILIMIRTFILIFILIGAPFLLIDSVVVIPKFTSYVEKIRSTFFNQLFLAPVFMIFFYLTLQIMTILSPLERVSGGANISNITGDGKNVGLFFGITMMLMLLYFMLKITKEMSGQLGQMTTNFVNKGVGMVAGGALGGMAIASRATVGRGAAALRDSQWVKNNQDTFIGRKAYDLSHSVANSTFDARNSAVAQKFTANTGMKLGGGGKIGYEAELKEKIDDRMTRAGRIETNYDRDILDSKGNVIHKQGDTNVAGMEAKRKFFNRAGGVLTNKKEMKESLFEKDREQALADNTKLNAYNKLTGDKRQNKYYNEQDNAMREQFVNQDRTQAEKENKMRAEQNKNTNNESSEKDKQKTSASNNGQYDMGGEQFTNQNKNTAANDEQFDNLAASDQDLADALREYIKQQKESQQGNKGASKKSENTEEANRRTTYNNDGTIFKGNTKSEPRYEGNATQVGPENNSQQTQQIGAPTRQLEYKPKIEQKSVSQTPPENPSPSTSSDLEQIEKQKLAQTPSIPVSATAGINSNTIATSNNNVEDAEIISENNFKEQIRNVTPSTPLLEYKPETPPENPPTPPSAPATIAKAPQDENKTNAPGEETV